MKQEPTAHENGVPLYTKETILQLIKEMRPATVALKDKPGSWWLDRFEEAVKQLKERA